MNLEINQRGFENGKFKDSYNNECSIQKSSAAMNDFIWLGINEPKLIVLSSSFVGIKHKIMTEVQMFKIKNEC